MTKGKLQAVLLIAVFLLIVAVICSWLTGRNSGVQKTGTDLPDYSPTVETYAPIINSAEPVVTASPVPGAVGNITIEPGAVQETPVPEASVAPIEEPAQETESPEATPEPTPVPTPTPIPSPTPEASWSRQTIAQGTFTSNSGTRLNIICDWLAVTSGSQTVDVTLIVRAQSEALYTKAFSDGLHYSLGSRSATGSTDAISYNGNRGYTTNSLGYYTFTIILNPGESTTQAVKVEWPFNGKYGGVELGSLICSGDITISRK